MKLKPKKMTHCNDILIGTMYLFINFVCFAFNDPNF